LDNGVIKAAAIWEHAADGFNLHIINCETGGAEGDFGAAQVVDSTFDSVALENLPSNFLAQDFPTIIGQFIYDNYNIQNSGSGSAHWNVNNIEYGMIGTQRYGIGYFYFYVPIPNQTRPEPITPSTTARVNFPPAWLLNTEVSSKTLKTPSTIINQWLAVRYGIR
jgi:hypothetical protein